MAKRKRVNEPVIEMPEVVWIPVRLIQQIKRDVARRCAEIAERAANEAHDIAEDMRRNNMGDGSHYCVAADCAQGTAAAIRREFGLNAEEPEAK
jgi:hypothetical protein